MIKKVSTRCIIRICFCILLLNLIGLSALYSSLHQAGRFTNFRLFHKQILWIALAWVILFVSTSVNYRIYYKISFLIYTIVAVLLVLVELFGKKVMGAQRWLSIFGFNLQPSEFAKVAIIFVLARLFSSSSGRDFIKVFFGLSLVAIYVLLIFKQPDLGTAVIVLFLFILIGLASKIKKYYFFGLIVIGLLILPLSWNFLHDYQKKRILVFLNPNIDPLGAGYTVIQSKIAIGSGKIFGKGFLAGTQNQFNFLPERHTDFIFTVIAEEWGFLGGIVLLAIYWILLNTILRIATLSKDYFGYILTIGCGFLIFLHIVINIGMTGGIFPVVGLPLFFISYGGSHLFATFFILGVILNICRHIE